MITFDDARHRVELEFPRSDYAGHFPSMEPFVASVDGAEDGQSFLIRSEKPALDAAGMPAMDVPVIFVEKSSGMVTFEPVILNFKRLDKMTPVHSTEVPTS
ncbi:hypothetical protein CH274_15430 [Rhodococcus sp. 06-418-5]|uniref:hypothetical protein n=1 Tax=unclassified Rhodococcus (in: high G+C Gram-positive bacteria) TaxID=192944 RepID=UPI000B9A2BD5|nr:MULTISPECIES: hypothetical protein [unclassified Rhodococcus (in: high G+C Gram-positive bacteria)]OZC80560.1 hypothetical protein CH274_15430 [Rhodococcus sp. 06-418-5]OZE13371.1 hypothetical protein CH250_05510 [Rhodococcus sp. 05-2255-3C]OZE16016.1 hypothetical protein CH249_01855 [Rhodococcus sp. 05-2255-3B1]OZE19056.1 hypothetical protein CH255_13880 [Rhodococcus sp. 05-2255-2A2]